MNVIGNAEYQTYNIENGLEKLFSNIDESTNKMKSTEN